MARTKLIKHLLKINIPLFEENLEVVFTNNVNKIWKKYDTEYLCEDEDTYGVCIVTENKIAIIYELPCTINTLIHEISHCVDEILLFKGYDLNERGSQETKATLTGYLAEKIYEFYKTL